MTSPIIASGSQAMASLASQAIRYTGGDTHLGRRVRLGAAVTLLALALHTVVAVGISGSPCSKKKKRRDAIQEDLRKVGKAVAAAGDIVVESEDDLDDDFDEYDIVVVGGGTAGCVLASRLSKNPNVRVLLLEAGPSALKNPLVRTPSGFGMLFGTPLVFDLYTTLQQGSGGKSHYMPRGKMLGGCSSLNAQVSHYGDPSDYDEWARLGGDGAESWAYKDFQKYFRKFEKFVPSEAFPGVDADEHGSDGPVEIGFHDNYSDITQRFIKACGSMGIPLRADLNTSRGTVGVAKFMTYIDSHGRRVSTDSAYLTPEVLSRPNLTVAVGASATRITFDTSGSSPRAVAVEFASSKDSPRFCVHANKEVILAAGAIHSPHILMLSGIGPAAHLAEHEIPVIAALPGVGEHLMDHAVVDVALAETGGNTLTFLNPQNLWHWIKRMHAILTYTFTGRGPLTCIVAEGAAFFRSTDPALFPQHTLALPAHAEDSTSGPCAPDLEFFPSPLAYTETGKGSLPNTEMFGLHMVLLRPTSKGNVRLQSSDPFQHPLIDTNFLSTEHDLTVLERGMSILTRVMHTAPLADIIDHTASDKRLGHWLPTANLAELRAYIRSHLETLYHPTSTARMAPLSDCGVVDARLRVHGVQSLRVVDASVFPTIIAGHTAGATIAVAEKAADLVLEDLARPSNVA